MRLCKKLSKTAVTHRSKLRFIRPTGVANATGLCYTKYVLCRILDTI